MNLGETYPDILFEVLGNTFGFIHYDRGPGWAKTPL